LPPAKLLDGVARDPLAALDRVADRGGQPAAVRDDRGLRVEDAPGGCRRTRLPDAAPGGGGRQAADVRPKTSCRTKATRSAGVIASSTTSNAIVIDSSSVTRSAGSAIHPVSPGGGSGIHSPTYRSRRTRAEPSWSRQIRLATVVSHAPGDAMASRRGPDSAYHRP
jgi:hypothetical protein